MDWMTPFYKGYKGEIIWLENDNYLCKGNADIDLSNCMINITELPIKVGIEKYK